MAKKRNIVHLGSKGQIIIPAEVELLKQVPSRSGGGRLDLEEHRLGFRKGVLHRREHHLPSVSGANQEESASWKRGSLAAGVIDAGLTREISGSSLPERHRQLRGARLAITEY